MLMRVPRGAGPGGVVSVPVEFHVMTSNGSGLPRRHPG
jgi:hypothetical protein